MADERPKIRTLARRMRNAQGDFGANKAMFLDRCREMMAGGATLADLAILTEFAESTIRTWLKESA